MEKYIYIEKYFEGTLTQEEEQIFHDLLEQDADFSKEFEFEKNTKKAITLNSRNALKEKLKTFEEVKRSQKSYKMAYVAAGFAVFFAVFMWQTFFTTNYDTIYEDHYHTYPNTVAPTVRGEAAVTLKSNAFDAYDYGNYEEAILLFSQIHKKENVDYALFYKGLSLLETKRYEEALNVFNTFDYSKENNFKPFFIWYSALTNLKLKNKEKAVHLLKELANTNNPQKEAAALLLLELE